MDTLAGKSIARLVLSAERLTQSTYRLMTLSAFSLPSFAGGIAGVASGLPLGFHGGFPRCLLSEFRIAGLLLGFQRGLTRGSLGGLRSG
jgi:hypothetical protein